MAPPLKKKPKLAASTRVTRSSSIQMKSDSESDNELEYSEPDESSLMIGEEEEEDQRDSSIEFISNSKTTEMITIDTTDDEEELEPPVIQKKNGKLSGRKLLQLDLAALVERYGGKADAQVQNFRKGEDENIEFTLLRDDREIKLVIVFLESSDYPGSQIMCYAESEISTEIGNILSEITELPPTADRSLSGLISYLVSRIILKEPRPFSKSIPRVVKESQNDSDDEEHGYDEWNDEIFGIGGGVKQSAAMRSALRADFKLIIAAGYRPGFTRVSELENVVSVSTKVNSLQIDVRTLEAYDSSLITGEVVYLVLLLFFGPKYPCDPDGGTRGDVRFAVGISPTAKPSKSAITAASRSASSADVWTKGDFECISLSKPLESLMNERFAEFLLVRRRNHDIGWAAAEEHCLTNGANTKINKKTSKAIDLAEVAGTASYRLPVDALLSTTTYNCYPLVAFSFLVRRFLMCPIYCLVCYKKVGIVSIKPYVCDNQLCLFQHEKLNLGPSLEHEIKTNAPAVDLLIQLAFAAAKDNALSVLPDGLELRVPLNAHLVYSYKNNDPTIEFDSIATLEAKNAAIVLIINELPPISLVRAWLLGENLTVAEKSMSKKRTLQNFRDSSISLSAWKLLRWIVASNTSYLKLIEEEDELVQGIPASYRQFRILVGSPAKETAFKRESQLARASDANAARFSTLWAFHGSKVSNFNEIIRDGLNFKKTTNGRAYGHGIYFAKEGSISLGTYATYATSQWKNADFGIGKLAAICEIINLPSQFVSTNPYLVVDKMDWVQLRVLVVQRGASYNYEASTTATVDDKTTTAGSLRSLPMDPAHRLLLNNIPVTIPDVLTKLEALDRELEDEEEELNDSDKDLMKEPSFIIPPVKAKIIEKKAQAVFKPVDNSILNLIPRIPAPTTSSSGTVVNIQRELKEVMKTQKLEGPIVSGFYFDAERSGDNVFNWIVEMIIDDATLPLAQDMKREGVSSLVFEIRFPQNYPMAPPFIRLAYPRLLPFLAGGGGNVTIGGSICMDLLTTDGWSPAYAISSVLLQIKMAICSVETRAARLDRNWKTPYTMNEAISAFQRSAATHGWAVDPSFASLARGGAF